MAGFLAGHKKAALISVLAVAVVIAGVLIGTRIHTQQQYYGEYYITATGSKYHEADCIFVKDKTTATRMTMEEYESGEYDRCQICLP